MEDRYPYSPYLPVVPMVPSQPATLDSNAANNRKRKRLPINRPKATTTKISRPKDDKKIWSNAVRQVAAKFRNNERDLVQRISDYFLEPNSQTRKLLLDHLPCRQTAGHSNPINFSMTPHKKITGIVVMWQLCGHQECTSGMQREFEELSEFVKQNQARLNDLRAIKEKLEEFESEYLELYNTLHRESVPELTKIGLTDGTCLAKGCSEPSKWGFFIRSAKNSQTLNLGLECYCKNHLANIRSTYVAALSLWDKHSKEAQNSQPTASAA